MFSHIVIGANDIDAAKAFYDATFGVLGLPEGTIDSRGRIRYVDGNDVLVITRPLDGRAATGANGGTIGFHAADAAEVSAWHEAGLAHGGTTCENPPGLRHTPMGDMYLAYLRDPSGNKLCVKFVP
ncbi:VOC family protein [Acetobacter sp. AN02]|uniref:VOC family protein n=1 Tax=Acetobacter sp. AN02 TaxID=2894186 RepID=UPI0024343F47|nr:VOC family protein [Acetobacter sp. AN02]MDG6095089.1 VOC family protein [Acetobacter sp. AN02]